MSTLPIRIRESIRPDGTRARSLLVFCPRDAESIPPERCARCKFRCPPLNEALAPAVGCGAEPGEGEAHADSDALLYGPHAIAARVTAGTASARVVLCIEAGAPLSAAGPLRWLGLPVVDASGVLLGSVSSAVVADLTAAEAMRPTFAVRESDHLDEAIGAMTSHHLRHIPIVDDHRRVTGILSDLELLRWVARGAPLRWR